MPQYDTCPCGRPKVRRSPVCGRCRERRERCRVCGDPRRPGRSWCEACALAVGLALQINDECPGRRPPEGIREALVAYYRGRAERLLPLFEDREEVAG